MTDKDNLLERAAERLKQKADGEAQTEQTDDGATDGVEEKAAELADEYDVKQGTIEDAVSTIAEQSDEDVSRTDVIEMLEPILDEVEGAAGDMPPEEDDDEDEDDEDDVEQEADESGTKSFEEKLNEHGVVTDEKLSETTDELREEIVGDISEKLEGVLEDTVEDVAQKAHSGATNSPAGGNTSEAIDLDEQIEQATEGSL